MEGADDERSAVSSDLGDASEDEELGALGDFRPSALGLSPPPGRLFINALADRDKAVAALRTKLHRADKAATDAANAADATAEHNARLETEILRLVKHRDELAQLRSALSQLRAQQQQQPPPPPGAYPPAAYPPPPGAFAPPPGPPPVVLAPPSAAPSVAPSARSSPRGMPPHTTPRQPAAATPGYYSRSRAVVPEVA